MFLRTVFLSQLLSAAFSALPVVASPFVTSPGVASYPALPLTGDNIGDWTPSGWTVIFTARGDLDKDGRTDLALIIESKEKMPEDRSWPGTDWSTEDEARTLVILFARKEGGYRLAVQDHRVILRAGEGGIMGDPLEGLLIRNGVVVLQYYGGSAWRWSIIAGFRYQGGAFHLIGYTRESFNIHTGEHEETDYNLSTGKARFSKWRDGNCQPCRNKKACLNTDMCESGQRQIYDKIQWKHPGRQKISLSNFFCWRPPE